MIRTERPRRAHGPTLGRRPRARIVSGLLTLALSLGLAATRAAADPKPPRVAGPVLIKNLKIERRPGDRAEGSILIEAGRIVALGDVDAPPGARIIDAGGAIAYAGFIDAWSHVGLGDAKPAESDRAGRESTPPDLRAGPPIRTPSARRKGLHPAWSVAEAWKSDDKAIAAARRVGWTAARVLPRWGYVGGRGAVVLLREGSRRQVVFRPEVAMQGSFLSGGAPGYPSTAMGVTAHLRQFFFDARRHKDWRELYRARPDEVERPPFDADLEATDAVLEGSLPWVFAARERTELLRILRLCDEHKLRIQLADAEEAWRIKGELARRRSPVIAAIDWPKKPEDPRKEKKKKETEKKKDKQAEGDKGAREKDSKEKDPKDPEGKDAKGKDAKGKDAKGKPDHAKPHRRPLDRAGAIAFGPDGDKPEAAKPSKDKSGKGKPATDEADKDDKDEARAKAEAARVKAIGDRLRTPTRETAFLRETWRERVRNTVELWRAGVPLAISGRGLRDDADLLKRLRLLIEEGMPEEAIVRSLTETPATLLGLDGELGRLAPGRIANITILSGPIKDKDSRLRMVVVEGRIQEFKTPKKRKAAKGKGKEAAKAEPSVKAGGVWKVDIAGQIQGEMTLQQRGAKIEGTFRSGFGEADITGEVVGDRVLLVATGEAQGRRYRIELEGTVTGDKISGTLDSPFGQDQPWTGVRIPKETNTAFPMPPVGHGWSGCGCGRSGE